MRNTINSIDAAICSGCGTCMNVCPCNAIEMKYSDDGFYIPRIIEERCINCGVCYQKCPVIHPVYENTMEPDCYAVWASQEIRANSSSGGVFSLLANYVWERDGAVAGAVFAKDYRSVHHIVTRDKNDLLRLRTSKYLQSEIRFVYNEIVALLDKKVPVLFVGTPCQVAGLKSIVGSNENLLLVDIACKSVPSTKAYNVYLDEIAGGREVESVAFRDKLLWGWSTSLRVRFTDKTQYYQAEWKGEPFYRGFLGRIIDRESCSTCPYANISRQGDITLADFWGIHKKEQSWDDRYGTSLVLVNNEKGNNAMKNIQKDILRIEEMDLKFAINNNPALAQPLPKHARRDVFFRNLDSLGYRSALRMAENEHYDAGIIGFWIGTNYGTILTNYALNRVLQSKGLDVCMIDTCAGKPRDADYPVYYNHRKEFEKKYYNVVAEPDLARLNECIDTFIVGSDQVWKYELTKSFGHVMFMDFVSDKNRKISYASSFGDGSFNNEGAYRRVAAYLLKRFDAVSVREDHAVDVCREKFGVEASHVLDPIFMCPKEYYDLLAVESTRFIEQDYLFAYILDPSPIKRQLLLNMANRFKLKLIVVLDCEPWRFDSQKKAMNLDDNVLDTIFVEDFVRLLSDSKAVITDSFHGTAFSVIYHKPFLSIANTGRGFARFESLLNLLHLSDRIIYPYEEVDESYREEQLKTSLPTQTYDIIEEAKQKSDKWLDDALFSERHVDSNCYNDQIYAQACRIGRLEKEIVNLKKNMEGLKEEKNSHSSKDIEVGEKSRNVRGWGVGAKHCMMENGPAHTAKWFKEKVWNYYFKK